MYSKVLQKIIAEANITQEELSKKCKELNVPISRGQINAILNNRANAPTEDISRTIAKVCNVDERELVLEGYLEKAPCEFIEFLNKFQEQLFELSIGLLENKIEKDLKSILLEEYKKQTLVQLILEILDNKDTFVLNDTNLKIETLKDNKIINFEIPYITMEDNSMESKIPKNSKLKLIIPDKYKNGDIVLVEYNNTKYIRLAIFIGRNVFLYPFNKDYQSFYLENNECKILAKINSVEIKL